jgi:hypothetical protein
MTNAPINFKQERDFGDLFNATFSFISTEFKKLATAILYFVVPLLLLASIAMTIYSVKAQEMAQSIVQGEKPDPFAIFSTMSSLIGYIGVTLILSLVASTVLFATVYGYIKLYVQKGSDGFSITDVWLQVSQYFVSILGGSIVVGLVIVAGVIFCLIPGIYFAVALSIVFCIMIFEDISFFTAFSRSFKLMKTNWWNAFGVMFVATIIVYLLSILVSVPSMVLGFKSLLTNMKEGQHLTMDFSLSFYIVSSITRLFTQIFAVIPIVISAFLYFSIVEKMEKPSLMDKINQIGDNA